MASHPRKNSDPSTPKGRTRFRSRGIDSGFSPCDFENGRGINLKNKAGAGGFSKEYVNSPRSSIRKKRAEIRSNQRDAKANDRVALDYEDDDEIFETNIIIGGQNAKGSSNVMMLGSSRPLRCLSTSCVSEKDFVDELEKPSPKGSKGKQKRRPKIKPQKQSFSDQIRSRFINRLKQVITAGNNRQNQAEMDRKIDLKQQKYRMNSTELIWLELQSWFNDRTLVEQDNILFNARQSLVMDVLSFVSVFEFNTRYVTFMQELESRIEIAMQRIPEATCSSCNAFIPTEGLDDSSDKLSNRNESFSSHLSTSDELTNGSGTVMDLNMEGSVTMSSLLHIIFPSDSYVQSQKDALKKVGELLKLLCVIESLYPSSSMLAREYSYYSSDEFQSKVESLCCWYNLTTDLQCKFVSLLHVLMINTTYSDLSYKEDYQPDESSNGCGCSGGMDDGDHNETLPSMYEIDIDKLVCGYTDRILKQKSVKDVLQMFIQRYFASLFRAKMNLMSNSLYEPIKFKGAGENSDICAHCASLRANLEGKADVPMPSSHCHMCSYRLNERTKKSQLQKFHVLLQKMEKVLSISNCGISAEGLDVIMENSTAVASSEAMNALFGLPCLKPIYLFFPSAIFALMKQCMHLRMKQTMPFFCNNNSGVGLLTAKQLVLESKEILECALLARDLTKFFCSDVVDGEHASAVSSAFDDYEIDLHSIVNTYLDFVDTWLVRMQKDLPHVPRGFHGNLEQEWKFSCTIMSQIGFDTLVLSAERFIMISAKIVNSTKEFLATAIRELVLPLSEGGTTPTTPNAHTVNGYEENGSNMFGTHGSRSGHRGKAGVLWYQHQRSESPHLSRHDSSQSGESALDSPVFNRQFSSASNSSGSSFPWSSYRSTSYLGYHKRYLFEVCRAIRDLHNETRERAIKILHFGKRLRKTLEPAIGYDIIDSSLLRKTGPYCCAHCQLIDALNSEGYVLVDLSEALLKLEWKMKATEANADSKSNFNLSDYWMFIPDPNAILDEVDSTQVDSKAVWSLIEGTLLDHIQKACSDEASNESDEQTRLRCVVLIKKPSETHGSRRQSEVVIAFKKKGRNRNKKETNASQPPFWQKTKSENNLLSFKEEPKKCSTWYGKTVSVDCADNDKCLTTIELITKSFEITHDVTVISTSAEDVGVIRKEFNSLFQSSTKLAIAQMAVVTGIKTAFDNLRECVLALCVSLMDCIDWILGNLEIQSEKMTQQRMSRNGSVDMDSRRQVKSEINEVMQSCFNFNFDFIKEATRIMSGTFRHKITKLHVASATQWMDYVLKHREKGKGHRPRWASQGLTFLVSLDMSYMYSLSEEDFSKLKDKIDSFIHHLIGDKPTTPHQHEKSCTLSNKGHSKSFASLNLPEHETQILRSLSNPSTTDTAPHSPASIEEDPEELELVDGGENEDFSPIERVRYEIEEMDLESDRKRMEAGIIGRVSDAPSQLPIVNLGVRTVNFRWQRGARVGEGAFGQVYTCVNVDTGTVLAMKEVKFHPNDHKKIRSTIDEYTNFEGIRHTNLVHYYGVELHRDEMYIFMEYCDSGTLGDICKISLPEVMVRRYTAQILSAVHVLHSRGIVHRDIKGSNIFLTSSGIVKLGDFGSAIKLRNTAKTTPGEMVSHIGTTLPYAAPEVINASESIGYGRASDIWSLGCVVIEMSSGKQPWQGLESFQVMFRVGMGDAPAIPEILSEEGKDFVRMCTAPNPLKRWTAEKLLGHSFVKVPDVDETT